MLKDFKQDEKLKGYDDIGIQIYSKSHQSSVQTSETDSNNIQNDLNTNIAKGEEFNKADELYLRLRNAFQGDVSFEI